MLNYRISEKWRERERELRTLYARIKILGSCLFLQSVPANLERERDRQTDRDRDRETDRDRQRQRQRDTERQRETEAERQTETERERDRETDRQTDREIEPRIAALGLPGPL